MERSVARARHLCNFTADLQNTLEHAYRLETERWRLMFSRVLSLDCMYAGREMTSAFVMLDNVIVPVLHTGTLVYHSLSVGIYINDIL